MKKRVKRRGVTVACFLALGRRGRSFSSSDVAAMDGRIGGLEGGGVFEKSITAVCGWK